MKNTFLPGWYAILPSSDLKSHKKPTAIKRFGLELVLWRNQKKQAVVMLDRCPHRGAKLSLGKVCQNTIRCPYHGFQFAEQGACEFAPEFNKPLPGLTAKHLTSIEKMGMIWVFWGETPTAFNYPELDAIHHQFKGRYSQTQRTWHSHITYCIENQLDYTHLRYVHHNTIGKNFKMPEKPEGKFTEKCIAIYLDKKTPALQLLFPNTWMLNISDKIKLLVYFAPISESKTLLYLRTYRCFLNFPIIRPLLDKIFNKVNLIILNQDEKIVRSQGKVPSYLAKGDTLMKHDKAVKFFRELCLKYLN